jgi:hypothetical protein
MKRIGLERWLVLPVFEVYSSKASLSDDGSLTWRLTWSGHYSTVSEMRPRNPLNHPKQSLTWSSTLFELVNHSKTDESSSNDSWKLARDSAQDFLALLAEVNETSISELVGPTAKAKLLDGPAGPIFNKPLRALPFPIQVGIIDAVTWLVQLRPTVVEFTDEYIRLFHEVLALADVDDQALIGKPGLMKSEQWLKTLRISCIRLLRSSMATPEFQENTNLSGSRTRQVHFVRFGEKYD